MVSQFEEMGTVLGDLGLALIAMAKYEDEEGAKTGSYTDSSAAARDIAADARRVGMVGSLRLSVYHLRWTRHCCQVPASLSSPLSAARPHASAQYNCNLTF